jgi:hypothetical protein
MTYVCKPYVRLSTPSRTSLTHTLVFLSVGSGGTAAPIVYEWDLRNMNGVPNRTFGKEHDDGAGPGVGSLALDPQRRHVYSAVGGNLDCWDLTTGTPHLEI